MMTKSSPIPIAALSFFAAAALLFDPAAAQAQEAARELGSVTLSIGEVRYEAPGQAAVDLKAGDVVLVGGKVTTGADSRVVILTSRQSAIRAGSDSVLVLEEMAEPEDGEKPRVTVDLSSGSLGALIKSQDFGEMDFKVRTPHGVAAARGTHFAVVVGEGKSYAQVREGSIEIATEGAAEGGGGEAGNELGRAIPPADGGGDAADGAAQQD